ncbi:MAG: M14 family zinc carboxypeptidase [Flavobacteriaceae bacterium]|nr:M14 family zinc carboxypeptidase [Flavobacteriaceae bacterium]
MDLYTSWFNTYAQKQIAGRYIYSAHLTEFLDGLGDLFEKRTIGYSVDKRPILSFTYGEGSVTLLFWSQMHGNESTTTKAMMDLFALMDSDELKVRAWKKAFRMVFIPILNPDGAFEYTRINANGVDLNRDASMLTQPESMALRKVFESEQPDFCFNLHGQRTIFNPKGIPKPATMSFLTPATDPTREVTPSRVPSMQLIAAMDKVLQNYIPNGVGRYDDGFNIHCTGDYFQSEGCPTVLFEAGHFPDDYEREHTRKMVFIALVSSLEALVDVSYSQFDVDAYFRIPPNAKQFYDILVEKAHIWKPELTVGAKVGILYREVLRNAQICFEPYIAEVGELRNKFGHQLRNAADAEDLKSLQKLFMDQ